MTPPTREELPHVPAAFINAISEEGTKEEAVDWLQKQWNENCALRAELVALRTAAQASKELAETQAHLALRNSDLGIVLSALRYLEEATGEKFDDEGGDVAAIERDYNKAHRLAETDRGGK